MAFGLDLTKRETQSKLKAADFPWERSKAFTGSALFSDFVSTRGAHPTERGAQGRCRGASKADVSLMLYQPNVILQELNQFLVLEDFDVVMTGTPAGVSAVHDRRALIVGRVLDGKDELVSGDWVAQ